MQWHHLQASLQVACKPSASASHLSMLNAALQAVTHYNDPSILAEVSCGLGVAMVGIDCRVEGFQSYAARSE